MTECRSSEFATAGIRFTDQPGSCHSTLLKGMDVVQRCPETGIMMLAIELPHDMSELDAFGGGCVSLSHEYFTLLQACLSKASVCNALLKLLTVGQLAAFCRSMQSQLILRTLPSTAGRLPFASMLDGRRAQRTLQAYLAEWSSLTGRATWLHLCCLRR